jgi:hypothetical protein
MSLLSVLTITLVVLLSFELAIYVLNKIVRTLSNIPNPYAELSEVIAYEEE